MLQGPLSRFGDTAANTGVLTLLNNLEHTKDLNVGVKTVAASASAAIFRIFLMPIDTVKVSYIIFIMMYNTSSWMWFVVRMYHTAVYLTLLHALYHHNTRHIRRLCKSLVNSRRSSTRSNLPDRQHSTMVPWQPRQPPLSVTTHGSLLTTFYRKKSPNKIPHWVNWVVVPLWDLVPALFPIPAATVFASVKSTNNPFRNKFRILKWSERSLRKAESRVSCFGVWKPRFFRMVFKVSCLVFCGSTLKKSSFPKLNEQNNKLVYQVSP